MSHAATNWAILQRGLKPATKLVLWYLCDRHNPDLGCFPTQARLAADAEMSVSALNEHLAILEEAKLIRRIRRVDPETRQQLSTRYILGFEDEDPQEPTPETGDGIDPEPSPENGDSRLRIPETNSVREPGKKKKSASASDFSQVGWDSLLEIAGYPPGAKVPSWWKGATALAHVAGWGTAYGLTEDQILKCAEIERSGRKEPLQGPKGLDEAMRRYASTLALLRPPAPASGATAGPSTVAGSVARDEGLIVAAEWINGDKPLFGGGPSPSTVRRLLEAGLVTPERARERGVI